MPSFRGIRTPQVPGARCVDRDKRSRASHAATPGHRRLAAVNRACHSQHESATIPWVRIRDPQGRYAMRISMRRAFGAMAVAVVAAVGTASIAGAAAPPKFQTTVNDNFLPGGGIEFVVQPAPTVVPTGI